MKYQFFKCVAAGVLALSASVSVCAGASAPAEKAAPACHLRRAAEMELFPDDGHRPVIRTSLNGTLEYFLVDTAGVYNAISEDTANSLKMVVRKGNLRLTHLATGTDIDKYTYGKLMIGPLPLPRIAMAVMPSDIMSSRIQGLLGGEFLRVFDLEIDPAAKKLSFFLHSDCGAGVVHWTSSPYTVLDFRMNNRTAAGNWMVGQNVKDYHIVVPAELDGHEVSATIDTGADVSLLQMGDAETLLSEDELKKMKQTGSISEKGTDPDDASYVYKFGSLDLNGIAVRNLKVVILPGKRSHADKLMDSRPQLIIGDDVLSKLHMYIAYDQHKLYITGAGAR